MVPAQRINLRFQRAAKAFGTVRGPSLETDTSLALIGLGVCDGAHMLEVMKKVKGPAQAKAWTGHPPSV
jgi:hypothetical protein